jgi:hypothetical protein
MSREFSDGLRKFGDDLKRKVNALPKTVSFPDLFNPDFMRRHTRVPTIEALFEVGGFDVNSMEDLKAIPDDAWEANIRAHTSFQSWEEMQQVAGAEWIKKKLT